MSDHFAAFSFVDRIVEFEPGKRAVGRYDVPAGIAAFPSCLVAEAVGQLAAWVSMEHIAFRGRPVAALATETRFRGDVAPGDTLDLSVDLGQVDGHSLGVIHATWRDGRLEIDRDEELALEQVAQAVTGTVLRISMPPVAEGAKVVALRK